MRGPLESGAPSGASRRAVRSRTASSGTAFAASTGTVRVRAGEPEPYGPTQVRQAYVTAGDTVALIVQEKRGGAAATAFHQTVILQEQLLG